MAPPEGPGASPPLPLAPGTRSPHFSPALSRPLRDSCAPAPRRARGNPSGSPLRRESVAGAGGRSPAAALDVPRESGRPVSAGSDRESPPSRDDRAAPRAASGEEPAQGAVD